MKLDKGIGGKLIVVGLELEIGDADECFSEDLEEVVDCGYFGLTLRYHLVFIIIIDIIVRRGLYYLSLLLDGLEVDVYL